QVEFSAESGGDTFTAPVDVASGPNFRTLLLGMKPDTTYNYRIVANDGACTSESRPITTGSPPNSFPDVNIESGSFSQGFYSMSTGVGAGSGLAFIFDQDGDPVWWTS